MDSLVSVIIPAYNASSYIGDAIESVLRQSYQHWELIVVDDCSTDDTVAKVRPFVDGDSRIQLIKAPFHSGGYPSLPRNLGIEKAKGRFIAFLDADDVWEADKLDSQIPLFDGKTPIVFSNYRVVGKDGKDLGAVNAPKFVQYKKLLEINYIACSSVVVDTECVGKFAFPVIHYEDYALWLSLLRRGGQAKNTGKIGFSYRVRKGSVSARKEEAIIRWWRIYQREGLNVIQSCYYIVNHTLRGLIKWMRLRK
ncbi:MAG: glycosyltransferase family 2 protein [Bacteroidaceae bacterium]|nr:glycosyltransferase family 2 protein [Bacteroidaceae bacterium]